MYGVLLPCVDLRGASRYAHGVQHPTLCALLVFDYTRCSGMVQSWYRQMLHQMVQACPDVSRVVGQASHHSAVSWSGASSWLLCCLHAAHRRPTVIGSFDNLAFWQL
jgi:hypothetical protein